MIEQIFDLILEQQKNNNELIDSLVNNNTEKIDLIDNKINIVNNNKQFFLNFSYLIGFFLILGINIYLYNNGWFSFLDSSDKISKVGHFIDMNIIGNTLFKLSAEISKFCTVKSWDIIHNILKNLEKDSYNKQQIITELENLQDLNLKFPDEFSLNSDSFEKCLIKLINFLKEVL